MIVEQGKSYIGNQATENDVCEFISKCIQKDNKIVEDDAISDAILADSWEINYTWKDEELVDYFNNDGYFQEFELYYRNKNNEPVEIKEQDIFKVYCVWMKAYDTQYLIYIFETKDHHLLLGCNNPD